MTTEPIEVEEEEEEAPEERKATSVATCCVMAAAAGAASVVQAGMNSELSEAFLRGGARQLQATAINFVVGLIVISAVSLANKPAHSSWRLKKASWYHFLGGPCGVLYISCTVLLSRRLGAALFYVILVSGTLCASLVFDAVGFLGLVKQRITRRRLLSIVALLCGAVLVQDIGGDGSSQGSSTSERVGYGCIVLVTGLFLPLQTCFNKGLGAVVGSPYRATVISFSGGVITVTTLCFILHFAYESTTYHSSDWWAWFGGVCGAYFVCAAVVAVPVIGAGWYYCILVAAQLTAAFFFDTFGFLGYDRESVTPMRVCGVVLTVASAVFYSVPSLPGCLAACDVPLFTGQPTDCPEEGNEVNHEGE